MRPQTPLHLEQFGASMVTWAKRTSEARWFEWLTVGVIIANAAVLGLETFPIMERNHGARLTFLNEACFAYYVVELMIRITAYGRRPWQFFKTGWNIFDFVIVAVGFVPEFRQNATLVRMVRLLRITRLFRLLPDLRIIVNAVGRSLPGMSSLILASAMLVYVYAMVGWVIFHVGDPAHFANIGEAMLTMFQVLTLEGLPEFIATGREVTPWAIPFYVSYVLLASFLVFNLFIGIVLNSMEEARAEELRRIEQELAEKSGGISEQQAARLALQERVHLIREHLSEIESDLDALRRVEEEAAKS